MNLINSGPNSAISPFHSIVNMQYVGYAGCPLVFYRANIRYVSLFCFEFHRFNSEISAVS